jgi:LacI family transcriptional regulator
MLLSILSKRNSPFRRSRKRCAGVEVSPIRRTTIIDVAKTAGVSISTVSRVLNGKGVKKETQAKVIGAIEQLDFTPDLTARSMISKETKTIGMLVPNLTNEFWGQMAEAIQEELWNHGYSLILCSFNFEMDREIAFLKMFVDRKVDGIIFMASSPTLGNYDYSHIYEWKRKFQVPFVTLDHNIQDLSGVIGDTIQSAMNAVEHLVRLGHRDIAYVGGPAVSMDREVGYRKALMKNDLIRNERLIVLGRGQSFDFGYDALKRLLRTKERFTAVFCGNDLIAMGAMNALNKVGIRVPEEVAIVGYDDIHLAAMLKPSLTTVRQPIKQISKELIQLLLSSMTNEEERNQIKKIMVPNELIIRESCGMQLSALSNS